MDTMITIPLAPGVTARIKSLTGKSAHMNGKEIVIIKVGSTRSTVRVCDPPAPESDAPLGVVVIAFPNEFLDAAAKVGFSAIAETYGLPSISGDATVGFKCETFDCEMPVGPVTITESSRRGARRAA